MNDERLEAPSDDLEFVQAENVRLMNEVGMLNRFYLAAMERHHKLGLSVLRHAAKADWPAVVESVVESLDAVDAWGYDDDEAILETARICASSVVPKEETP